MHNTYGWVLSVLLMHTILPQGTKEEQLNLEYIVGDGETTSIKILERQNKY